MPQKVEAKRETKRNLGSEALRGAENNTQHSAINAKHSVTQERPHERYSSESMKMLDCPNTEHLNTEHRHFQENTRETAGQATAWADDHLHLRLFKMDYLPIDTNWNAQSVQSSFWRFYFNDRDGAALELPDSLYPLEAGRLTFVPAGVRFNCRCTHPVQHFYVHFDVIGLPEVVMRELFAHPIPLPQEARLTQAMQSILADMARVSPQSDLALQCRVKALLYEGLALYLRDLSPAQQQRSHQLRHVLQPLLPAIERVERELGTALSVAQLARDCHLSENHFIRRFRECVGQTPGQYIQERRVRLAAQKLLFTDDTIDTIAEACGFGNRFYFSRLFTRQVGVSPAAYRKAARH